MFFKPCLCPRSLEFHNVSDAVLVVGTKILKNTKLELEITYTPNRHISLNIMAHAALPESLI
jgi:hypothetical protein